MSAIGTEKQRIRKQLLMNRNSHARPQDFSSQLGQLIESQSGLIASYSATDTEPETKSINKLLSSQKKLVLPEISGSNLIWRIPETLVPGPHGIKTPIGPKVELDQVSLVLAPALAVDSKGFRLGKGGGYYDRALQGFAGLVYALVFESEYLESLPIENHDVKIHGVITEKTVRTF